MSKFSKLTLLIETLRNTEGVVFFGNGDIDPNYDSYNNIEDVTGKIIKFDPAYEAIENLVFELSSLFIKENGQANYVLIDEFNRQHEGLSITKGEGDSFGWLSGILNIKGFGKLVYG